MILSVNPEDEICKHFRHLVKNNGTVEWGTRPIGSDKIEKLKKQKLFYAYTYITGKAGIKYRFLVEDFNSNTEGQETIPPFDYKNVPQHYFEQDNAPESESWLKIKKIEKINTPLPRVNEFKTSDGKPVKAEYVIRPIYVLDMPLKTSILTESDCPDDLKGSNMFNIYPTKDLILKAHNELRKTKISKKELITKLKEIVGRDGKVLVDDETAWNEIQTLSDEIS